jgi:hypothetical protein
MSVGHVDVLSLGRGGGEDPEEGNEGYNSQNCVISGVGPNSKLELQLPIKGKQVSFVYLELLFLATC